MSADGHLGSSDRFQRYQQILADFSRMVADSSDIPALLQLTAVQAARGIVGNLGMSALRPGSHGSRVFERAATWGRDKIGATAYANLDKKGTQ
jgi:hypothetical protein